MIPSGSLYTARLSASLDGTLTETDEGSDVVVVVAIACVVGHVTTGSATDEEDTSAPAAVVETEDETEDETEGEGDDEDVVVGRDVPEVEPGPEPPHPLRTIAAATAAVAPTTRTLMTYRLSPESQEPAASMRSPHRAVRPPANRPDAYASTVSDSNNPAKRRCASARRVGMCSLGTSRAT